MPLTYIYHTGYLFCLFLFGEIYKIYKSVTADFLDLQFHIHNNDIKRNKSVAVQWANLDTVQNLMFTCRTVIVCYEHFKSSYSID